jgi:mono/diheme cytochrome c family protein
MGQWGVGQDAVGSGIARNHIAMGWGVPTPYDGLRNPLPRTRATIERGASVYARSCAGCHGDTGLGDGPTGRTLSPPPANLAWLSRMPMNRWDAYMYWTVAEGGAPLKTAMPSFQASLSKNDTGAVIAYIQAMLPRTKSR